MSLRLVARHLFTGNQFIMSRHATRARKEAGAVVILSAPISRYRMLSCRPPRRRDRQSCGETCRLVLNAVLAT